jgi:hypothetical protein
VNIFNRVVIVLDILLTMVVITLLLAFPVQSLSVIMETASALLRLVARIRPEYTVLSQALLLLIAVLVDFFLLLLLISEFRGPRRKTIRVASVSGGEVRVTIDSIANRLRYHIDPLPDILSVKPRVSRKGNGVALSLEVEASADVNVPRKAEEVLDITRQVIEEKMGLKLAGKPQVQVRMVPYPPGSSHPAPSPLSPAQETRVPGPAFTPSQPAELPAPATPEHPD